MENNKNKKSVKFQGDMLNFYDFIQVFVFTTNHHLKQRKRLTLLFSLLFRYSLHPVDLTLLLTLKVPGTTIAEFANSVDLDDVAHDEPPHLDLYCLHSSL